ncbi:MAG: hypothetical protein FJ297_03705 [Planctomycetes bacterium]|nr:hypothetical protein [Planctomycetota bacterium]
MTFRNGGDPNACDVCGIPLIANGAIGTPEDGVQGVYPYRIGLKAPAKPGDYMIEITTVTPKQLVARGKVTVVPEETKAKERFAK